MGKKSLVTLSLSCSLLLNANAQTCIYRAYDGFGGTAGQPLHGQSSGSGWGGPWQVQNNSTSVPGYQLAAMSGSLSYADLQTSGNHAVGGTQYLTAGRGLNTSTDGPFGDLTTDPWSGIGSVAEGGTLWVSVLLMKENLNGVDCFIDLHGDNIATCNNCTQQRIGMGYFGSASDVGGEPRWSLRLGSAVYTTSHAVVAGQAALLVAGITFATGGTEVALYVNPAEIGDQAPALADITQTADEAVQLRAVAVFLGHEPGSGAVDELRVATSYRCATPDSGTPVDGPPTAVINASPTSGNVPITVNFDGSASFDPEAGPLTYTWSLGDGSPAVQGAVVTHTYDGPIGQLTATLTVTDQSGQSHTAVQTITVLNASGSFPCQASVTCVAMASCGAEDGHLRINLQGGVSAELLSGGIPIAPESGSDYTGLAPGQYLMVADGPGGCTDTLQLTMRVDSATCTGWMPTHCMEVGINLPEFADWEPHRTTRNLMKNTRGEPIAFTPEDGGWQVDGLLDAMDMDADGYPTRIPQSVPEGSAMLRYYLSSEGRNLQPGQSYVLLYDGTGVIEMQGESEVTSSLSGRIAFNVVGGGNVWMNLTQSQQGDHVRNIRIVRPEDESADLDAEPFYSVFLEKLEPFTCLRFMDWGHINNSVLQHWEDRTPMTYFSYGREEGTPFELMADLCNLTGKKPWVCVPHAADDELVTRMAELFRDRLDPGLDIYLEYSNEVWNWIFEQAQYNNQTRPSNLEYTRAYAEKAKRVFRIWHEVFGEQRHRVKRVLGLQGAFSYANEQVMAQLGQDEWDLASPGHYVGLDHEGLGSPALNASSTAADVLANSMNHFTDIAGAMRQDYLNAHLLGKDVVTYEGGQHFVGNVFGIPYDYQEAMWEAQYHPGMYDLYMALHDSLHHWGCRMAVNFSLAGPQENIYGSWGVLSDIDLQPPYMTSAPKYQAMLDLACEALVVSSPSESVISSAGQLTVWPNPSEGQLTIGISGSDARPVSKVMYDLQGRPVFSDLTASATFNSQLPSGIYLLEVMMEGEQWPRLTKVILSR